MMPSRSIWISILSAALVGVVAGAAHAASCPGGGSLDITVASDSLTLTPTPAATFNFGEHVIVTAQPTGFTIATYAWTIDGPTIKDYNEDLGTKNTPAPAAPLPWSTTALSAADLSAATVGFYFVPSSVQNEPNNGPFVRNIALAATKSGGGTCNVTVAVNVERNESNIDRQAEDFFTSNHRASTATNPLFGHAIDEHIFWHHDVHDSTTFPTWTRFLAWHGEFVRRFDRWRQEFGYVKVAPWYPGRPLPTGPQFDVDPSLRNTYVPDNNRLPTYYTITGGSMNDPNIGGTHRKLADYATLDDFTSSFEGSFHGTVHCDIGATLGGSFFETSGADYGSMCLASSPKDPMFWRWHGFIDVLYRNFCALHTGACPVPSPADPASDPWMADNGSDTGAVPSPGTHWISPDVWNRRAPVTTDACVGPIDSYGDQLTTGGVVRDCGSSADHENPEAGRTNYLYGTLRNTLAAKPRVVYAEVGVYYALASSGLTYPADFTFLPDSRQFIALHFEPGTSTSIGPIPWTVPPLPPANDHYCLYLRVLSVQETPPVEGAGIDTDVANSNSLAWRNIKVVPPGDTSPAAFFIVRNFRREAREIGLRFEVPAALIAQGVRVQIALDATLARAFKEGRHRVIGMKATGDRVFVLESERAFLDGLSLAYKQEGHVKVSIAGAGKAARGDVTITQVSAQGVDGGVTLRLQGERRPKPPGKYGKY